MKRRQRKDKKDSRRQMSDEKTEERRWRDRCQRDDPTTPAMVRFERVRLEYFGAWDAFLHRKADK